MNVKNKRTDELVVCFLEQQSELGVNEEKNPVDRLLGAFYYRPLPPNITAAVLTRMEVSR
jgi:hypothetical protein